MEKALRYELNQIPEIENKIFPVNVPEGKKPPFLVYMLSRHSQVKTLQGYKNIHEATYVLNIMAETYSQVKNITQKVKDVLVSFPKRKIGKEKVFIQDIEIENTSETYEPELDLCRSVIEITFFYKEE